jgi:ligand-binding sensor domain-containing protein
MAGDTSRLDYVYMDWSKVFDLWPDAPTVDDDEVQSMTFCPDGSLWVGSIDHGLAQINTTTGAVSGYGLPGGGQNVWALACDSAGSLWISTDWGEVVRYDTTKGSFSMAPPGLPELANHVAWNIQVDEFSKPRVVYFAMRPLQGKPGGIVAYSGP